MRLTELDPRWVGSGGPGVYQNTHQPCPDCFPIQDGQRTECSRCLGTGEIHVEAPQRHGIGLSFLCPCPTCTAKRTGDPDGDFCLRLFVAVNPPLDGGPVQHDERHVWARTGDTFETLRLTPSILSTPPHGCGWHGYVGLQVPGEVTTC